MSEVSNRILESINIILKKEIPQEDLKETIQKYIDTQKRKGFPFAELNGAELDKVISVAAAIEL
ncbi:hypothetical protein LIT32_26950 (plasmid) [Bacillus sp. CMF21]|nr:hypothetical protein LIT32_26950 [Bacillus sp. CMF21]